MPDILSPDWHQLAYGEARASGPVTTFRGAGWQVDGRAIVVVGVNEKGGTQPQRS